MAGIPLRHKSRWLGLQTGIIVHGRSEVMTQPLPKISVITPCFNSIHTIHQTIESVASQNYPALEHIVMDGGSKDGTVELLKQHPHLIWASEKDEGHYHAMNKGIQR